MSDWSIRVPFFGERDEDIGLAISQTRHYSDAEEGQIVRQILIGMQCDGAGTIGAALDRLEGAGQAGRRQLLDRARMAVGLPDTETVEIREHNAAAAAVAVPPPFPRCPACNRYPTDSLGFPDWNIPPVKRWWCEEHRDQAEPGDLGPPPSGIRLDMTPIPDPAEVEREQRRDERLAEQQRERNEERTLRAREAAEVQRVFDEQIKAGLFGGQV
jgi:hypothetical protein